MQHRRRQAIFQAAKRAFHTRLTAAQQAVIRERQK